MQTTKMANLRIKIKRFLDAKAFGGANLAFLM